MEMYYCNSKGGIHTPALILAMLMMIVMLLNAYCSSAAVLAKSNTSFRCSSGRLDEILIEEDLELELGFLMNPYVSRILTGNQGGSPPNSNNPQQPAYPKPCGKPQDPQYSSCVNKNKQNNHQCVKKGIYGGRGC
ncbi:hypothetical protein I3843_03G116300 [Carya illinoinensis]|uniref:Rapid ALkalinization Factor n=1 Tax=Carya illinoinensis TaxID=32201 RepID=A0A922DEA1_CARIL|nr:hypothetical protein I3842_13G159900 [Carya illinoinensis]KAG7987112.1 hypothetical protein I3843_03G116300 [Carya illinoinensis]